ncbi:single-stranded DNA-binding protein [Paucibacter sp. R3-3]|uniref:Single-stranded DNA-binding protein n=1 Tax=Roseateles agri TaxID=3098619 RepID=A0ABU5DTX9_9BURK|nr:single-stranded DNA-binding protein [Paucibacter sp. R3-3]MDY0748767.1 single-stranded DNA-binding protein [Paucibacter sp. R3-3]
MASVNKVIIVGNLGRDPELRYNPSGVAFCSVSIATTRQWKNRESGERQEETEWHRVVFNDKLAEIVGEYCKKGRSLYVEGRLRTRKWQDKEGRDTYTTEIIATEMQMLGGRDGGGEGGEGGGGGGYGRSSAPRGGDDYGDAPAAAPRAPARTAAPAPRAPAAARPAPTKSSTGFDDMDDDIPF